MDQVKSHFHPRNKHRSSYDFSLLIEVCPELKPFVFINKYQSETIDFSDADAVKLLNKALLKQFYKIEFWEVPDGYLIPPIPGRADYIHHLSELLAESNKGVVPTGLKINLLDIGVGANCIYPIIACSEYGWRFTGTEIDKKASESAKEIVQNNSVLKDKGSIYFQANEKSVFSGIVQDNTKFDLSICNPPFHTSKEEATVGSLRKLKNLSKNKRVKLKLNFGGQSNELWCEGGEEAFIKKMMVESKEIPKSIFWFTSLVSKESSLVGLLKTLKSIEVNEYRLIEMNTGNKKARFISWTFLTKNEQINWVNKRWK